MAGSGSFLIYRSKADGPGIRREELDRILLDARRGNDPLGVSGLLLCEGGAFVQLLQGPEPALTHLLRRIRNDPRHRDLALLSSGQGPTLFPGRPMVGPGEVGPDLLRRVRADLGDGGALHRLVLDIARRLPSVARPHAQPCRSDGGMDCCGDLTRSRPLGAPRDRAWRGDVRPMAPAMPETTKPN